MGDPVSMTALAATGLSAFGGFGAASTAARNARQQGQSAFLSATMSEEQAQLAAEEGQLKATQTDTAMRDQMGGALSTMHAVLANSGAQDNSPSGWAVANRFEEMSTEARAQSTTNIRMGAQASSNASLLYAMSGMNALNIANGNASADLTNGLLSAGGSLLKGLSGLPMFQPMTAVGSPAVAAGGYGSPSPSSAAARAAQVSNAYFQ